MCGDNFLVELFVSFKTLAYLILFMHYYYVTLLHYSFLTHYFMWKFVFVLRHFHFATSSITHHFASPLRISLRILPVRDFTVRTSRFTHTRRSVVLRVGGDFSHTARMIDSCADKDYNDRLKELGLTTLETWRKRGDLIEAFKIIKGFEDVDSELFFPLAIKNAHLRGYELIFFKTVLNLGKTYSSGIPLNYYSSGI